VAHDLRGIGGLHAIWLPSREDTLMELPLPVPVRFGIVLDKQVAPEWQDGVLTSMSRRRGDLSSSVHLPPLTNLCMRVLQEDGTEIPEDMYGKVVSSDPAGPATVHFTSPSPLSLAYLERRLPTTTP
jgi:hypothetical protein